MTQAQSGNTVSVHYTGTLTDGTEFDSSRGREPLQFTLGSGSVIPGFDSAITGMSTGDSKTVTIACEDAYGQHNAEMVQDVPRSAMPDNIELAPGMVLNAQGPEGQTLSFSVVEFDDTQVKLDGNHPLAGKDLTFALELVEIS